MFPPLQSQKTQGCDRLIRAKLHAYEVGERALVIQIAFILLTVLMAQPSPAAIQSLPFTDHFTHSQGNLFSVAAGVWDSAGNTGAELVVSNVAALTSPSGFTNASGNGVRWSPSGTSRRAGVQFTSVPNTDGNAVYVSFLLKIQSAPGSGSKLIGYLDNSSSSTTSPQLGIFVDSSSQVGIGKKATSPAITSGGLGTSTHLVVVRYTFAGGNDLADLWVDPSSATYGAASPPASLGSTSGSSDPAALGYFQINAPSGTGPLLFLDEVRIGTNWADVTPGTGAPPSPPSPGSLRITNVSMSTQGIILRGANGTTNGAFTVLTSTSFALPITQWTAITTNIFDSAGNFNCTNATLLAEPQRYFTLRLGGDIGPAIPPAITSQPQNASAVVGENVLFSVTVTGSQPLYYQWYFNTNQLLSNQPGAALTITNIQLADAGGYFVVVTNIAGSVTSLTATLTIAEAPTNGDFYVAPTGNDANPGTLAEPFATIPRAVLVAAPGDIIYVRDGLHNYSSTIRITNSGTALAPIQLLAYPGEHPVLCFSNQPYGSANRGILITTNGNYWQFKGLEICYAGDNGVKVEGSHLRFEQCVFHHNGDSGMQIGFAHETVNPGASLAAYIEVINCDSYRNYDPDNRGSDADGFAAKLHCGQGIIFIGCRAWENSDDGWDLFETDASVVLTNCWQWHSGDGALFPGTGSFQGNGNGMKLGGNGAGGNSQGTHYAYNCVAFNNNYKGSAQGFTQNSHKDGEVIVHCLSFNSSGYNFFFEGGVNSGKANVFTNNVSLPRAGQTTGISFDPPTTEVNNSWNLPVTANAADYGDLREAAAAAPRKPDGSLPDGFARLVGGSDLIDKGANVGQPFNGSAPDLGPYEAP